MAYHHKITADELRRNLQERIEEISAELQALKGVTINTKHKTLTNAAISGEGARIGDYIGIGKALYVSYVVATDTRRKYESATITAYTYNNPDGSEIGTHGISRISRTMTPAELADVLRDVIEARANTLGELQSEYRRAATIARKQNKLIDAINEFNDGLSYAGKAQI